MFGAEPRLPPALPGMIFFCREILVNITKKYNQQLPWSTVTIRSTLEHRHYLFFRWILLLHLHVPTWVCHHRGRHQSEARPPRYSHSPEGAEGLAPPPPWYAELRGYYHLVVAGGNSFPVELAAPWSWWRLSAAGDLNRAQQDRLSQGC